MEFVRLGKTGEKIPSLGLGTFGIGGKFSAERSKDEYWIKLIRNAIEMGYTLIDTAEVYGKGHCEEIIGKAIKVFDREDLFIISKVSPENASLLKVLRSGLKSYERLGTYIDLYLIHFPPPLHFLPQMIRGMEKLVEMGIVRYIGVSNFSIELTKLAVELSKKEEIVANESELSLIFRKNLPLVEWCNKEKITFIAYSPLAQGEIFTHEIFKKLKEIGKKIGKSPVQIAIRWVLDKKTAALVMSSKEDHLRENLGALGWNLEKEI